MHRRHHIPIDTFEEVKNTGPVGSLKARKMQIFQHQNDADNEWFDLGWLCSGDN
jgi:hypothetical protein